LKKTNPSTPPSYKLVIAAVFVTPGGFLGAAGIRWRVNLVLWGIQL
jgi:hypothetical protein